MHVIWIRRSESTFEFVCYVEPHVRLVRCPLFTLRWSLTTNTIAKRQTRRQRKRVSIVPPRATKKTQQKLLHKELDMGIVRGVTADKATARILFARWSRSRSGIHLVVASSAVKLSFVVVAVVRFERHCLQCNGRRAYHPIVPGSDLNSQFETPSGIELLLREKYIYPQAYLLASLLV